MCVWRWDCDLGLFHVWGVFVLSRMTDFGKSCSTCRHLGNAEYTVVTDGESVTKRQCLESKRLPIWVKPDECCDKWETVV